MASKKVEIEAANKADIEEIGSTLFGYTARALSLRIDGKLIAVAGVLHTQHLQAFTVQTEDAKNHPFTLYKFFRKAAKIMESYRAPIYAIASDKYDTSDNLCKHFGFVEDEVNQYGRIYKWR